MPFTPGCLSLAAVCAIAAPSWAPVAAAPPQRVTLSAGPVAAGPPTRNMRGFFTGDGQVFVAAQPDGTLSMTASNGSRRSVQAGDVADAAMLRLSRGHAPRPHVVWVGRGGIGFAALDGETDASVMLALPGRGGAARAAAATSLAVAESGDGTPVILVGNDGGGVTALKVSDRHGNIRLKFSGHWPVGGGVTAITADGARARIATAGGVWSLDLGAARPVAILETASDSTR